MVIRESVGRLLERRQVRRLGLAGGVFANVRLNRLLAEALPVDEIFVVPPMGDEGLVIGGALQFLLERDGLATWLSHRRSPDKCVLGRRLTIFLADKVFANAPARRPRRGRSARLGRGLAVRGRIGAIYTGPMEYGPRALGARSILANPADPRITETLNHRLKRSEFMPFAPVVNEEDAGEVFDLGNVNRYAARFMTISCGVRRPWRDRIPGVVHIDGSARPQLINRAENPLLFRHPRRRSRRAPDCRRW